jgi:cellulose synthase/poly-beta-1,6-N-acetylglucosamine synthase-like glycosyltransferase
MTVVFSAVLTAMLALLALPVLLLLIQVLAAMAPRRAADVPTLARPRLAVLVPAHNEGSGILSTIHCVLPQLHADDRLVVVADNCSDNTAQMAAAAGAEVIERHDLMRRGKGYALDFGVQHLRADAPDIVIVIDADCLVAPQALDRIARVCGETGRPVQALYLMTSPPSAGPMAPIAEFAWVVKNQVRPLGYYRLGQPCQLMGTGMAFSWNVLGMVPLASGHIVEDLKMGIDLAAAGFAPLFCPEALVTSVFPESSEGTKSQRTRWEHGHLAMITGEAPGYLLRALRSANTGLLALVLDLCVPPLALLTLAVVASCAVGLAFYAVSGHPEVLQLALLTLAGLGLAVLLAWVRFGRKVLSFGRLAYAPFYALRKIPLYLKFVVSRQVEWIRSKRDQR